MFSTDITKEEEIFITKMNPKNIFNNKYTFMIAEDEINKKIYIFKKGLITFNNYFKCRLIKDKD